jgi:GNAT superfamily N-acetyltransferase
MSDDSLALGRERLPSVVIRRRRGADIVPLGVLLLAQQLDTQYPFRDPLPIPVEDFLHAKDAVGAWTAEIDGHPIGHVCRTGALAGFSDAAAMNDTCARAHGCGEDELAWVSTLFVGASVRGAGVGRALLTTVVANMSDDKVRPCLEVLPNHPAALALYEATGWKTVMKIRPRWLIAATGDTGPDVHVMVLLQ